MLIASFSYLGIVSEQRDERLTSRTVEIAIAWKSLARSRLNEIVSVLQVGAYDRTEATVSVGRETPSTTKAWFSYPADLTTT